MWSFIYKCKHTFLQTYQKIRAHFTHTKKMRTKNPSRALNWTPPLPIRKSEFKDLEMDKENKEIEEHFLTIFEWQFGSNKKSLNYRCWEQSIYWYYEKLQILSLLPYNVQRTYKLEKLVCFLKSSWTVHKLLC